MLKILIEENVTSSEIIQKGLKELNINNYIIKRNKNGYPYIENIKNIYFNVSNKDNVTICVFSNKKIGVDLEKPIYKERLLNRFFTENEKMYLQKSNNKSIDFMKMWIIKESYVKSLGIGINYGLNKVDSLKLEKRIKKGRYKEYYYAIYE